MISWNMRILNRILRLHSVFPRKLPTRTESDFQTSSTFQSIIWLIRFIDSTPWFGLNWLKALIILPSEFRYKIILPIRIWCLIYVIMYIHMQWISLTLFITMDKTLLTGWQTAGRISITVIVGSFSIMLHSVAYM